MGRTGDVQRAIDLLKRGGNVSVKRRVGTMYVQAPLCDGLTCSLPHARHAILPLQLSDSTPLHLACEWGHEALAELLIANGADIEAKAGVGYNPKQPPSRASLSFLPYPFCSLL